MLDPDEVYDRALNADFFQPGLRDGDHRVTAALLVHGMVYNGGVLNAVQDCFSARELDLAEEAFRWLDLVPVADVIAQTRAAVAGGPLSSKKADKLETRADDRYHDVLESDDDLIERIEARIRSHPDEFAPFDD